MIVTRYIKLILVLLFLATSAFADESMLDFGEKDLPILNEELRKKDVAIDINTDDIDDNTTDITTNATAITALEGQSRVVQQVHTMPGSQVYAAAPVAVPIDDTKPQKTEGFEILSLAVTPKDATNILEVEVVGCFDCNAGARWWVMSLFKGTESDALATSWTHMQENAIDYGSPLAIRYQMVAGTTSEITFKVRAGTDAGSRMASNGIDAVGGRLFGGTSASSITITEYNFS